MAYLAVWPARGCSRCPAMIPPFESTRIGLLNPNSRDARRDPGDPRFRVGPGVPDLGDQPGHRRELSCLTQSRNAPAFLAGKDSGVQAGRPENVRRRQTFLVVAMTPRGEARRHQPTNGRRRDTSTLTGHA